MKKKLLLVLYFFILFFTILNFNNANSYYQPSENLQKILNSVSSSTSYSTNLDINSYYDVYVEDNSSLFHSYGCKELTRTPHKITLDVAIDRGYYACEVCNPLGLSEDNSATTTEDSRFDSFILVMIIGGIGISITLLYHFRQTGFVSSLLKIIMIACYIIIPIASCLLHVYTVYLYAMTYGFWGALLSFCLPVFSELFMAFDYIFAYGIFNSYLGLIVAYILIYIILIGVYYLMEDDQN